MRRPNFRGISGRAPTDDSPTPDCLKNRLGPPIPGSGKTPVITMWNFTGTAVKVYDFTDNEVGDYICTISSKAYLEFRAKHRKGQIFRTVNEFGIGELTI